MSRSRRFLHRHIYFNHLGTCSCTPMATLMVVLSIAGTLCPPLTGPSPKHTSSASLFAPTSTSGTTICPQYSSNFPVFKSHASTLASVFWTLPLANMSVINTHLLRVQ
ncbi:hypothetical protein V8F33_002012 [Rhypophila sp. PSN 637]